MDNLQDAKSILYHVASSLLTKGVSEDTNDWKFCKTTPEKDKKMIKVGQKITLHDLACAGIDTSFRTENGWAIYDTIDYPNNSSGWWVTVSRMTPEGCRSRKLHTDTSVIITQIRPNKCNH